MLDPHIPTFIMAAINLVVIYLILKKVLFVPVTKFMENRKEKILNGFKEAEEKQKKAEQREKEYSDLIEQARAEAAQARRDEIEKGRKEYDKIVKEARVEADRIRKQVHAELEKEREAMQKKVNDQVAGLSIQIATKLLKENMDTDKNKKLVNDYLNEEGVA